MNLRDKTQEVEIQNHRIKKLLIRFCDNTLYYRGELAGSWMDIVKDCVKAGLIDDETNGSSPTKGDEK